MPSAIACRSRGDSFYMSRALLTSIKGITGWHSREKYVAFAVDDYGNVRLASREARDHLESRIPGFGGQMDRFDAVETREDLEALFETLSSVVDRDGRNPVFTAYALSANPDFGRMGKERSYAYEILTQTFQRLAATQPHAYEGTWKLWQEGMQRGLLRPQFHGREHFNIPLLGEKLRRRDRDIEENLAVESLAGLSGVPDMPGVAFTQAFGLSDLSQLDQQREIIAEGLKLFEQIFGFASATFAPPGLKLHKSLDEYVWSLGVASIDKPFYGRQPAGKGRTRRSINFLSPPRKDRVGKIVRTLSFEPGSGIKPDPIGAALREIEVAFRWRKPAIISSHRVNYAGHIDPANRKKGLSQLSQLLGAIKKSWPDVRFVSIDELVAIMQSGSAHH